MKFLILKTLDPYINLAIEEYLFRYTNDDIFMLWQNDRTVVIGKNQNAYAEINMQMLEKENVKVARRITGGGAVYHDIGNLNYTFISSEKSGKGIDFEYFTRPIIDALASVGVAAELSGRNDLLTDGRKFSGNAQYSFGGRVLHHGTLLFDSDLDFLSSLLTVDKEKIISKGIKSTRSRVVNLKEVLPEGYDISSLITLISDFLVKSYSPEIITVPDSPEIDRLCERNASSEWLFPQKDMLSRYTLIKKKRFPFGGVEISIEMQNDVIKNINIRGDFFGTTAIEELEGLLKGVRISDVINKLSGMDVGEYIFGMSFEELAELILKG